MSSIQRIHKTIIDYLNGEIDSREGYLQREVQLLDEISDSNLTPKSARKLRLELNEIRERSMAHEKLLFYLAETSPLLEEYQTLLSTPLVKRGFMSKKKKVCKPEANEQLLRRKREITGEFIRIAANYCTNGLQLDLPPDPSVDCPATEEICEECGSNNVTINVTDSMVCCMECAYEFTMSVDNSDNLPVTTNTEDTTRINSRYEAILHFKNSMAKYQGKQQTTISKNVYADLHSEFARAGLLSDEIAVMSFDELVQSTREPPKKKGVMDRLIRPGEQIVIQTKPYGGAYDRITHDHIIFFLKESGHEKHYEDVMLIHYTITGISPPNIGSLEAILEQDFQILMGLYHQEYVLQQNPVLEDGKSFKSNYYILYHLLKKHGFPARKRDFTNMLKTPDREIFYDTVCKDLFSKLGWPFSSEF
jgi:hypothetical protein